MSADNSILNTTSTTSGMIVNDSTYGIVNEGTIPIRNVLSIVILYALTIVIVGGNILTILAVRSTRRLRTIANRYVVSLAVADLMAGLVLPFYAMKLFPGMKDTFNTNKHLCLSHYVVMIISAGNSMLTMVQIAADRLFYIAYPMKYSLITKLHTHLVIATSWIVSIILGTMPAYYNHWDTPLTNWSLGRCDLFHVIPMNYHLYVQVLIFCVCCIVSGSCYAWIFKISHRQRKSLPDISRKNSDTGVSRKFRREWPIMKMFFLVFGVFFVCWCPAMVGMVIGNTSGISPDVMDMLVAMCLLNSGMNFFIYGWKNRDFKIAFKSMLCRQKNDAFYSYADSANNSKGSINNDVKKPLSQTQKS